MATLTAVAAESGFFAAPEGVRVFLLLVAGEDLGVVDGLALGVVGLGFLGYKHGSKRKHQINRTAAS